MIDGDVGKKMAGIYHTDTLKFYFIFSKLIFVKMRKTNMKNLTQKWIN